MSGNSHQRIIAETAARKVLKKLLSPSPIPATELKGTLGRSSIEAYIFFILGAGYMALTAFRLSVNFYVGCFFSISISACALHLLWKSMWTETWNLPSRIVSSVMIVGASLFLISQGYALTHQKPATDSRGLQTLSAIGNLSLAIGEVKRQIASIPGPTSTVHIVKVSSDRPRIELEETFKELSTPGHALVNFKQVNLGSSKAHNAMSSSGLFVADIGKVHEDAIFSYLHKIEHDKAGIPNGDQPVGPDNWQTVPVGGDLRREDGTLANGDDRMALYSNSKVLYVALLISYQDDKGIIYHLEKCGYQNNTTHPVVFCIGHNSGD